MFAWAGSYAQVLQAPDSAKLAQMKTGKLKKKAKQQLKVSNYYDASDILEAYLAKEPDDMKRAYQLAHTYKTARDYKSAVKWFGIVAQTEPEAYPLAQYFYALMLKMTGRYEEAKEQFDAFAKGFRGKERQFRNWALIESKGCTAAMQLLSFPNKVLVEHLNDTVNSAYTDVAPMMWDDTTLLFASLPSDSIIRVNDRDTTTFSYYVQFYKSILTDTGFVNTGLFNKFNYPDAHTANGTYSKDGKRFYFSKCSDNTKGKLVCELMISEQDAQGGWGEAISLGDIINVKGYTTTHPTVGVDKNGNDVLYFASNREGGRGGMDIWYSYRKSNGTYSSPRNLGSRINTDRDEVTPFSFNDTLYFSSNGHENYGGYDVYKTTGSLSRWEAPVNMGYPINGPTDDMYYYTNGAGKAGYFVSNRPGIISVKSETCCDDIFRYQMFEKKHIAVQGFVYDEDDSTHTPLDSSRVTLFTGNMGTGEMDAELGIDTASSKEMYFFNIDFEQGYRVKGEHAGYLSNSASFNSFGVERSDTLQVDIYLKKYEIGKAYQLRNIYYDYDKWFLREASMKTLDTLYQIMIDNPSIIVELGSHTDARATENYNIVLSQHRAESAMIYLLSRGIPQERLTAKGYGESRHLEDCSGYADCPEAGAGDCPCHQMNRRTEFKVIGELDAPFKYNDIRYDDLQKQE